MTWSNFFLICFLVGFALSLLAFMAGALRLPVHHHGVGHAFGHHGGHLVGHHTGGHFSGARGVSSGPAAHAAAGSAQVADSAAAGSQISPLNFSTAMAFLAWFGGAGYLLTHYYSVWYVTALAAGTVSGLFGATAVFLFIAKVLLPHETLLDPADFVMEGVLGTVISAVRQGGTGEIAYTQGGSRYAAPARSDDSTAIEKGDEVVVTRYERGIAYVRKWDELVK